MLLCVNMSNLNNKKIMKNNIAEKVFDAFTDGFQENIEDLIPIFYTTDNKKETEEIVELVLDKVGELYGTRVYKKPHKTIQLVVENDYNSGFSFDLYKEDLLNCAEDLDIIVKHKNNDYNHVLKDHDNVVTMDYKYKKTIECRGYSQSEWDTYTIYYKEWNDQTQLLADLLKNIFTHKNDYIVYVNEIIDHEHTKIVDKFCFSIIDTEFPDHDRIREEIEEYSLDNDIKFNNIVYNLNN